MKIALICFVLFYLLPSFSSEYGEDEKNIDCTKSIQISRDLAAKVKRKLTQLEESDKKDEMIRTKDK
jgi:hypothetical protein